VNGWLREQFARPDVADRRDVIEAAPSYDERTRRGMVEELRRMGTDTALRLADTLLRQ
jgi:hypothetical protein